MLTLNPELNSYFETFFNEAVQRGTLPEREKVVAILTSAFLLGDQTTLKNAIITAKQLGFTNEEIGQVSAIAIAVNSQRLNNQVEIRITSENNQINTCCQ